MRPFMQQIDGGNWGDRTPFSTSQNTAVTGSADLIGGVALV